MENKQMVKVAVVGCGYWGPNYVRTFNELPSSSVSLLCDINTERLKQIKRIYPFIKITTNLPEILENSKIDAVCVSTPASTHYKIVKESLLHGKHVLVEKPLTLNVKEGEDLVKIAQDQKRILMVGHVYLYHPAVQKVKSFIQNGELNNLYYLHSIRTGLGPIRRDTNAMWDLAPHDISIYMYLLDQMPKNISARGASYLQDGIEDVVSLSMEFQRQIMGYIHVSWLDAYKIRKLTIVSKNKMVEFDDTNSNEKLKIFNQGVSPQEPSTYGEFLLQVRTGDIYIPKIEPLEPLRNQCLDFIKCVENNIDPLATGIEGVKVVKVLNAAKASLNGNSSLVEIGQ
jgi:predicted dehydrogenase